MNSEHCGPSAQFDVVFGFCLALQGYGHMAKWRLCLARWHDMVFGRAASPGSSPFLDPVGMPSGEEMTVNFKS